MPCVNWSESIDDNVSRENPNETNHILLIHEKTKNQHKSEIKQKLIDRLANYQLKIVLSRLILLKKIFVHKKREKEYKRDEKLKNKLKHVSLVLSMVKLVRRAGYELSLLVTWWVWRVHSEVNSALKRKIVIHLVFGLRWRQNILI